MTLLRKIAVPVTCYLALIFASAHAAQFDPPKRTPEEEAIDAIEERGGWTARDERIPGRPVTHVCFKEAIADADLDLVRIFLHLQNLDIMEGTITDDGLARLTKLTEIKELRIHRSQVTDRGLVHLKGLQRLESLSLDSPITGIGLVHLGGLPRFVSLSLSNAKFNDAGLRRLQELVQVESLDLTHVSMTDAGLFHLRGMNRLERLQLAADAITEEGVARLAGMSRLRWITIADTEITQAGATKLRKAIPYALITVFNANPVASGEPERAARWRNWSRVAYIVAAVVAIIAFVRLRRVQLAARRAWPRWWKAAVVMALVMAIGVGLAWFAPEMMPVREGNAAAFWLSACQIDTPEGEARLWGRAMLPRDDWFIYDVQGFHGQFLYRVKATDALFDFPRIVRILNAAPPGALLPEVSEGYRTWSRADRDQSDASGLLASIREARLVRLQKEDVDRFERALASDRAFDERWQRIQRYDLNILFEFLYLSFLIIFAAWPWLRNARPWRWALHIGMAPILFFLPYWLGYAQFSFTSAGPSGGVLYPWMLVWCHWLSGWNSVDTAIVRSLPKVLEPLSQSLGPMLSLSGFGAVGPTSAAMAGGISALAVYSWRKAMCWLAGTSRLEPPSHA